MPTTCSCMDHAVAIIPIVHFYYCLSVHAQVIGNPDHEAPRSLIFRMFPVPDLQAHPSNLHNCTCARFSSFVPCVCVCVCTRNAIGKRRGGSVGLWCNSPPLVNTAHPQIGGSCYRVCLGTTTCNLNALIFGVAPLEKTNYYC